MNNKPVTGQLNLARVIVVEEYEIQLEGEVLQSEVFRQDPAAYIRRFLEQQGMVVNRVTFRNDVSMDAAIGAVITREQGHWYHIVYPPNEASGWICA